MFQTDVIIYLLVTAFVAVLLVPSFALIVFSVYILWKDRHNGTTY